MLVDGIQALAAVVPGGAAVGNELDDTVLPVPGVARRCHPAVMHLRGVGAAVNVHVHGVLLGRIEVLGIVDDAGQFQPVHGDGDQLADAFSASRHRFHQCGMAFEVIQTHFPGGL